MCNETNVKKQMMRRNQSESNMHVKLMSVKFQLKGQIQLNNAAAK